MTQAFVAGDPVAARRAAEALIAAGREAHAWEDAPEEMDADGSSATLARCLVALEGVLERDRPDGVVVVDDSDAALAATLVASKLLIPIEIAEEAAAGESVNARLISQLAGAYTGRQ
jgi:hypothetical protein